MTNEQAAEVLVRVQTHRNALIDPPEGDAPEIAQLRWDLWEWNREFRQPGQDWDGTWYGPHQPGWPPQG